LHQADLFDGLTADGYVLINSAKGAVAPDQPRYRAIPASRLAIAHLGRPLPGAPMLGGLAALTGVVSLDAVVAALNERFTGKVAAGNVAAAIAAYELIAEVSTNA